MMNERKWKNAQSENGKDLYKPVDNKIRKCLKAKKEYWKKQCEEIEYFEKLGRTDKMYEKVKASTGGNKSKPGNSAAIKYNNDANMEELH